MRKRFLVVTAILLPLASTPASAQSGCARPAALTAPFAFSHLVGS
jgi:hypothetical protein